VKYKMRSGVGLEEALWPGPYPNARQYEPQTDEEGSSPDRKALVEASGGINIKNVREVAETGVNFISVGALTHSAPALDIGLYVV
jgi:nicotinate-nucleotide pyrophosphorylase